MVYSMSFELWYQVNVSFPEFVFIPNFNFPGASNMARLCNKSKSSRTRVSISSNHYFGCGVDYLEFDFTLIYLPVKSKLCIKTNYVITFISVNKVVV